MAKINTDEFIFMYSVDWVLVSNFPIFQCKIWLLYIHGYHTKQDSDTQYYAGNYLANITVLNVPYMETLH